MAWYDSIIPPGANGMSDADRKSLVNSGLLQTGLSILSANSTPGVTPGQAVAGGLLGGLGAVNRGAQQLQESRTQAQDQQFKQAQQQDLVQQMQRRRQIQDLARQFARPDGTFDQAGYRQALYQIDPESAQQLDANDARLKLTGLQTQKAQRDLSTAPTREIDQGLSKLTQEQQPDGTWKTIATASRFAPQQSAGSALEQQIAMMRKFGATDADIKSKLGIGASNENPSSWDDGLTDDQKKIAQGIANYSYPISSRFLQTKANQQLVSRAQMLNPDLNVPQYKQNEKLLADMASSTPNSAGGGIQALNTAATHVAEMADLSKSLPSGSYPWVNKTELTGSSLVGGKYGNTLKAWDTAKQLFAGEMAKAVKGGVASMQEVQELQAQMDASATPAQRAASLQATANFLNDRAQAAADRRDQILGSRSPGTSLLTKRAQDALRKVYGLTPDAHMPDFGAPSAGLGYRKSGPSTPTPSPSGAGANLQDALNQYGD